MMPAVLCVAARLLSPAFAHSSAQDPIFKGAREAEVNRDARQIKMAEEQCRRMTTNFPPAQLEHLVEYLGAERRVIVKPGIAPAPAHLEPQTLSGAARSGQWRSFAFQQIDDAIHRAHGKRLSLAVRPAHFDADLRLRTQTEVQTQVAATVVA